VAPHAPCAAPLPVSYTHARFCLALHAPGPSPISLWRALCGLPVVARVRARCATRKTRAAARTRITHHCAPRDAWHFAHRSASAGCLLPCAQQPVPFCRLPTCLRCTYLVAHSSRAARASRTTLRTCLPLQHAPRGALSRGRGTRVPFATLMACASRRTAFASAPGAPALSPRTHLQPPPVATAGARGAAIAHGTAA